MPYFNSSVLKTIYQSGAVTQNSQKKANVIKNKKEMLECRLNQPITFGITNAYKYILSELHKSPRQMGHYI